MRRAALFGIIDSEKGDCPLGGCRFSFRDVDKLSVASWWLRLIAYFLCLDVLNVGCYPLDTHADNIDL
nr:MAG TPA: hypothetical protein [Caudoviricetes sp.]